MTDLASLVLAIDSTSVPKATGELDQLTAAGARAEIATAGLGKGSKSASVAAAEMAAAAQASSRATLGVSAASTAAAGQVSKLTREVSTLASGMATGSVGAEGMAQSLGQIVLAGSRIPGVNLALLGIGTAAASAYGALKLMTAEFDKSDERKKFLDDLGLTDKELKKLKDTSITVGDAASGMWKFISDHSQADEAVASFRHFAIEEFKALLNAGVSAFGEVYGAVVGTYKSSVAIWHGFPAALGDAFYSAVNLAIGAINRLLQASVGGVNSFISKVNGIFGTSFATLAVPQIAMIGNAYAGAASKLAGDVRGIFRAEVAKGTALARGAIIELKNDIIGAYKGRLTDQAEDLIADRASKAAGAHRDRAKAAGEEAEASDRLRKSLEALLALKSPVDIGAEVLSKLDTPNLKDLLPDLPDFGAQLIDALRAVSDQAQSTAQIMSSAFGNVGDVFGSLIAGMAHYGEVQEQVSQAVATGAMTQATADKQLATLRARNVGSALAGFKSLFKEHSAGYKAMEAAERAFAIVQAISTIKSVAAGAAKMFAQLGVWAFPAVGAMIAVMAGLGFSGGSSSQKAPNSSADVQAAQGAGTVLGDSTAKSQSIVNSLDIMAKNSTKGLDYSSAMVRSLRKIESGIDNLAAAVARMFQSGGAFDTAGLNLGTKTSGIQGLFGSKTTTSLFDQGIEISAASVAQILSDGITGFTYQVIEKVKKKSGFLGIGGSTKTSYDTTTGALDSDFNRQVQLIIGDIYKSVVEAAKVLGLDVADALKTFQVEIGKISFKDMKGDEIAKALEAVFSKVADQMAGFAVAGLEQFQKAGEGLFETLMRLAKDYLTIDAALMSIGMTFGAVGAGSVAARESLIELAGGLDEFVSQVNYFYDHFLTGTQKIAFEQQQVDAAFQALGVSIPASIADFAKLVQGLDLSTDAGQQMFEALMEIAPAFYDVATAAEQLAQKQNELQVQLLQAQGRTEEAIALQRQLALAAMDPALRDLQQQVWAAQDAANAAAAATKLANQQQQLQIQLLQAQGSTSEALAMQRRLELAAMDESLRALQQQVWAAQDAAKVQAERDQAIQTAKDNLTAAYKREADALQQTIDKFRGFSKSLREFRDSLFQGGTGPGSFRQAMVNLMRVGGLAAAGDETALGQLQDVSQTFLSQAESNASSLVEYKRSQALVARYLDQAIGASEGKASIAELQLKKLHDQVDKLVDIDEHVQTVTEAIKALTLLMFPNSGGVPKTIRGRTQAEWVDAIKSGAVKVPANAAQLLDQNKDKLSAEQLEEIKKLLGEINASTAQNAVSSNELARKFKSADRGGAFAVVTDSDSPLATTGSGLDLSA